MIIPHPLLGPRDSQEFVYLGDASLIDRPDGLADDVERELQRAVARREPTGSQTANQRRRETGSDPSANLEVRRSG